VGKYFDYEPPKSAWDISSGIDKIGDALTDVLNRRQKQKQIDAELAQNATQQAINQRKANEDTQRFNRQNRIEEAGASANAIKAMREGDPQSAEVYVHGAGGTFEPGPIADVGPAPQAPVVPVSPAPVPPEIAARRRGQTSTSEEPSPYVSKGRPMLPPESVSDPLHPEPPVFTDDGPAPPSMVRTMGMAPDVQSQRISDTQDMAKEEQNRLDQAKYGKEKSAFDTADAAYPEQRLAYNQAEKRAIDERPYTIKYGPNDPGVKVDVASQRYRGRQQAADDFLASLDGLNLDEQGKQAAQSAHARILAGDDPKQAIRGFQAERVGLGNRQNSNEQKALDRASREKNAQTVAASPKDRNFESMIAERRASGTRQDLNSFRQDMSDWERNVAATAKDSGAYKRLKFALDNLESGNPVRQHEGAAGLVGFFRGANAVTSDAYKNIIGNVSGAGGRIEQAIESIQTGQYGEQNAAILRQAAHAAVDEQQQLMAQHHEAAKRLFGPGSGYENYAGNVNQRVSGVLHDLGYDGAPIYEAAGPSAQLGSTHRPYQPPAKAAARPAGAPPEVKAKDKAQKLKDVADALKQAGF
jgi:hypothetical protein